MIEKHEFKNFKGTIWVESYDDHIEPERCDIYDEYQNYIDYIDVENITKEEYDKYIDELLNAKNIEQFIKYIDDLLNAKNIEQFIKYFYYPNYEYSDDRLDLMYKIYDEERQSEDYDTHSKAMMDELRNDDEKLNDVEFCDKYLINKIGRYYFYMVD